MYALIQQVLKYCSMVILLILTVFSKTVKYPRFPLRGKKKKRACASMHDAKLFVLLLKLHKKACWSP